MTIIKSQSNEKIKLVKSLYRKKNRIEKGLFIIEGEKIVEEALEKGYKLDSIYISETYSNCDRALLEKAREESCQVYIVEDRLFNDISDTETPQGILALAHLFYNNFTDIENFKGNFYILIDQVQDPGNMGTILRSADAFGVDGVIIRKGSVDIYNPKVVRSTMGSIFRTDLYYLDELEDLERVIEDFGLDLISTSLEGDADLKSMDLSEGLLSIGNESKGISKEIEALSKRLIKIPMIGEAESLNVGVASSIIMYEAMLQKSSKIL